MRVDLSKYLFYGYEEDRSKFFEKAQDLGIVHFIEKGSLRVHEASQEVQDLDHAIKVLRGLPLGEQEEMIDYKKAPSIATHILRRKNSIEHLEEEKRMLVLEAERIHVFGDFSLEDVAYIEREGHYSLQFYCAKSGTHEQEQLPDHILYIGVDHGLDYFVAVNKEPTQYERMIEMKIDMRLSDIKSRLQKIDGEIHQESEQLKTFSKYNTYLHHALIAFINDDNLARAKQLPAEMLEERIFAIEGWVPVDKVEKLQSLCNEMRINAELINVGEDIPPTCLQNDGFSKVGEDLIHIYDTPSNTDKDPSLWVLFAFALFFAVIVGDGGYGLVFLATALYLHFKVHSPKRTYHRFKKLVFLLSVFCIGWGVITNSFFGIQFSLDSPIRKVSAMQWLVDKKAAYHIKHKDDTYRYWVKKFPDLASVSKPVDFLRGGAKMSPEGGVPDYLIVNKFNDSIMLEIALFIGVLHIILSMLRYIRRSYAFFGWILFIIGGYLYIPYYLNTPSLIHFAFGLNMQSAGQEGLYLIGIGFVLAIALSVVQHKLSGLTEIAGVIQIFADVLSYLRLYALALAGGIVSVIINETAASLWLIAAIPLIIFGHAINILLSVVGGVIHGLRLNFLEWYHYSFEGGGKMFNPLRKRVIE